MKIVDAAVRRLKDMPRLRAVVLFGSCARGDEDKHSDIDLLIVLDARNPKQHLKEVVERISPVDPEGKISPRVTNFRDYDASFFQNALREGKLLHGSLVVLGSTLGLKPYRLIHYDLSELKNTTKVRISRRVHGYSTMKGGKTYRYPGLVEEKDVAVMRSTVVVPESVSWFSDFLKREQVPFTEKLIWM